MSDQKPPAAYPPVVDTDGLSPAMLEINPQQRAFVYAMLDTGGNNPSHATRLAGYSASSTNVVHVTTYRLMHNPLILAAMKEEANRRLHSGVILGASVLVEIAKDPLHKDRLKAAQALLGHSGLVVAQEHRVIHENKDDKAMIDKITILAQQLGLDPRKLLGNAAPASMVTDAEFTDVTPTADGLEDLL